MEWITKKRMHFRLDRRKIAVTKSHTLVITPDVVEQTGKYIIIGLDKENGHLYVKGADRATGYCLTLDKKGGNWRICMNNLSNKRKLAAIKPNEYALFWDGIERAFFAIVDFEEVTND